MIFSRIYKFSFEFRQGHPVKIPCIVLCVMTEDLASSLGLELVDQSTTECVVLVKILHMKSVSKANVRI